MGGHMKIINCYSEFKRRTDPLMDLDFALLDIAPDFRIGIFRPSRLPELVTFCQNSPEYHIMSFFRDTLIDVNAVVEKAAFYRLGRGDSDPELMLVPKMSKAAAEELRILKFDTD